MLQLNVRLKVRKWVLAALLLSSAIAAYLGFAKVILPNDKAIHFIVFFQLTTLFYWTIETANRKLLRLLTLVCCVLIAGIGSEFAQNFITPMRKFDHKDIISNECGSLLALIISDFCNRRWGIARRTRRLPLINNDLELQQGIDDYETEEDGGTSNSSAYEYDDTVANDNDNERDEFIVVETPSI